MHPYQHFSVLQNASKSDLKLSPFPHIVINNALPEALAKDLTQAFDVSLFETLKTEHAKKLGKAINNRRIDVSYAMSKKMTGVPEVWQQFLDYHSSKEFFDAFVDLFGEEIVKVYGDVYPSIAHLKQLKTGIFQDDSLEQKDILLNTAMSINTPVIEPGSVRAIHTDHGDKLYSGLYYLRRPQDDSVGGNLQILKWKDGYSMLKKRFFYEEGVNPKHTEVVQEIPYSNNTFVMFINSLDALHAVTPRQITNFDRTFVNFIGISKHKLFKKELPIVKKFRKMLKANKSRSVDAY